MPRRQGTPVAPRGHHAVRRLPGFRGDFRLTRSELDDEIRQPLAELIDVLRELLFRNRIHLADLTAVATVGGGANIPAVTTALSQQLRVPVITSRNPELTAALGAAIRAANPVRSAAQSATLRALAWSEIDDVGEIVPMAIRSGAPRAIGSPRPRVRFVPDEPARVTASAQGWYRPLLVTAAVFAAMLFVGTGAIVALRNDASVMTGAPTTPTTVAPESIIQVAAPPAAEQPPAEAPSVPSFIQAPAGNKALLFVVHASA
jgi:Hsp70 protein